MKASNVVLMYCNFSNLYMVATTVLVELHNVTNNYLKSHCRLFHSMDDLAFLKNCW
jgi:hypothetical protein